MVRMKQDYFTKFHKYKILLRDRTTHRIDWLLDTDTSFEGNLRPPVLRWRDKRHLSTVEISGSDPEKDVSLAQSFIMNTGGPSVKEGEEIMVAQTVKVVNEQGLHMRPAGVFAKEMTKFSCAVTLDVAGKKINAKIIAACIKCGAEVTIECDGADEKEALAKAVELIESGFGE